MSCRRVAVLLLLALALKLAFLSAPRADLLGHHERTGQPLEFHGEEVSRASIALEVRDGPLMPVRDYQWSHPFGGSLVVGLAATPSFALFGPTLFSLKLVPLFFELLVVALGALLYDRLFGPRAAWIGGLLLAIASPGQALLSTVAWGTHASMNAFVMGGFLCYVASLERSPDGTVTRVRSGLRFLFGVISGFALWFGSSYLLALSAVVVLEFARDRREFLRRSTAAAAMGMLVGAIPWFRYNFANDFAGLRVDTGVDLASTSASQRLLELPARCVELVVEVFPAGLWHRDVGFLPGALLAVSATVALLALVMLGAWRLRGACVSLLRALFSWGPQRIDPAVLLLLHPTLYVLALMLSDHWNSLDASSLTPYFFLSPLFPGVFGLAAAGADARWEGRAGLALRPLAALLLVVFAATSLVGQLGLVRTERFGALWEIDADRRRGHGRWLAQRFGDDPPRMEELGRAIVERREEETRVVLLEGMANGLDVLIRHQEARGGPYDLDGLVESRRRLASSLPAEWGELFGPQSTR